MSTPLILLVLVPFIIFIFCWFILYNVFLIYAVGKAKFVIALTIKENAIVIDVGINRYEHNNLCGDVDFENGLPKVKMITSVPGGVGPMTISSLLENILYLYHINQTES